MQDGTNHKFCCYCLTFLIILYYILVVYYAFGVVRGKYDIFVRNNICINHVNDAFDAWKYRCSSDNRYKMRLLYTKALGDCSETGVYEEFVYLIQNTLCENKK